MSDGGLPALCALAIACEREIPAGSGRPLVVPFGPALHDEPRRIEVVQRQAQMLGGETLPAANSAQDAAHPGLREVASLLFAAHAAAAAGAVRLIWPETARRGDGVELDRLAQICDRALLVGRLVALDSAAGVAPGFVIETPFSDLSEQQIADLALDMGCPVETCWWWGLGLDGSQAQRELWVPALEHVGWRRPVTAVPAN